MNGSTTPVGGQAGRGGERLWSGTSVAAADGVDIFFAFAIKSGAAA
jgi:hypothetical protein